MNAQKKIGNPRVLVIGPGLAQTGGVATFFNILLTSPSLHEQFELIHLDITRGNRGHGHESSLSPLNFWYLLKQLVKFWQLTLHYRPAICHLPVTSSWSFWKDALFIQMAHLGGMRVVAHVHGGIFDQYYRGRSRLEKWLIRKTLEAADAVVALSGWWKTFIHEEISPKIRVAVIQNTVDHEFANLLLMNLDEEAVRDPDMVLFVGSVGERKGVLDILRAVPGVCADHPKVRFVFAGRVDNSDEHKRIEKMIADLGIQQAVTFLGNVTGQAKMDLFMKASIFLLPSHGENFPYAVLEAMGAGLPVVSTPVGAIPELVEEGVNGFLIRVGDVDAMTNRVVRLLKDKDLRNLISVENKKKIRGGYMPEEAMMKFAAVYYQALGEYRADLIPGLDGFPWG